MAQGGFTVDVGALESAEPGIRDAVTELGEMAGWGGAAAGEQGMGLKQKMFDSIAHVGPGTLGAALMGFGDAWEFGIRYLVEDGNAAVAALGEARAAYQRMDAEAEQKLIEALREG
ncbi:hypothetical protein [Saccharopolyspora elongata]|uniref:Excreted virulence factor EspC, type VII ESX diderm n=1 Tax=Saccharopolyspora elongata TaxID=2530387 RepID=A0A4V2YMW0_9PSEU|nr:hypothetical protein [Saccharopolyspora elongata]TDD51967.1 hypothetical protein E1288_13390 [Saccharopolyspora elongata]